MDAHVLREHGYSLCLAIFTLSVRCLTIDANNGLRYMETEEVTVHLGEKAPSIKSHATNKAP